jgi:hypothetical protein
MLNDLPIRANATEGLPVSLALNFLNMVVLANGLLAVGV